MFTQKESQLATLEEWVGGLAGSVVKLIIAEFKSSGSIESSPRTGRPHKTSPRHDNVIT